jgi:hypothetical protein
LFYFSHQLQQLAHKRMTRYFLPFGILLLSISAEAQTFGTGADGNLTVASGSTLYTDAERTTLSATAAAGVSSITVAANPGLVVGECVLIMQMAGAGVGSYETDPITVIAGNTFTLKNALTNTYTTGGANVVQVSKVMQYNNLTVQSGGIVTANAWNGSTGGVVFFCVKGTLDLQAGGKITASSIGFRGQTGGGSAAGGVAGAGGLTAGSAAPGLPGNLIGAGAGAGGAGALGAGAGGNGGITAVLGNGASISGTTGEGPNPGANNSNLGATPPAIVQMGGGGTGGASGAGGLGSGGGGGGGGSTGQLPGTTGGAGGVGGAGGNGGNGGGIVYIIASVFNRAGDLTADADNGTTGAPGTNGGIGGDGGHGGSTLGVGGLGGGGGGGGNGANGGAGGNGGNGGGGGVVYFTDSVQNTATGILSTSNGLGGAAGAGGAKGCGGAGGLKGTGLAGNGVNGTGGNCGNAGPAGIAGVTGSSVVTPLPVDWLSFNTKCSNNSPVLEWVTASETNNNYFSIERSGENNGFTEIARVSGAGTRSFSTTYSFEDENSKVSPCYYRLKQTDYNGNYSYSRLVSASCISCVYRGTVECLHNWITLGLVGNCPGSFKVDVINLLGETVLHTIIQYDANGREEYGLNANGMASGVYLLRLSGEKNILSLKFTVH